LPPTAMKAADLRRECQEVAAEISERYPNTPFALLVLAQSQTIQGKHVEAVKTWEKCLQADPRSVDAYDGLVDVLVRNGDYAKAVEIGRRAVAVTNRFAIYNNLGLALLQLNRPQEAIPVFEQNLKRNDPQSPPTLYLLGKAHMQLRKWDLAKRAFTAAIKASPDFVPAYYTLSRTCAQLGQKDESARYLAEFKRLERLTQDDMVQTRHARDQIHKDQPEYNIRDERALISGQLAPLHTTAGRVYYALRDARKAEEHWRRAAELNPADLPSRQALLALQRQEGRLDGAVGTLREMIAIEPRNPLHYLTLGMICGAQRQFDAAEQAFQKVRDLAPKDPAGYGLLAKLYVDAGRKTAEAPALARKAAELAPTGPHYALLAEACWKNHDAAGARAAVQEALRRDPKNADYQKFQETMAEKKK
jgi:tetratricopeptide (TPR) repeat protein